MKKLTHILALAFVLLSLNGCNFFKTASSKMEIKPAKLNDDEINICSLLGNDIQNSIFDFNVDSSAKAVSVNVYKLKGDKWEIINGGGGEAFSDTKGRIALTFDDIYYGHRFAIQSKSTNSATAVGIDKTEDDSRNGFSRATTLLSHPTLIEYEKEIPLAMQVSTSKNEIRAAFADFSHPEEIAKFGYEEVYAITVKFSQNSPD